MTKARTVLGYIVAPAIPALYMMLMPLVTGSPYSNRRVTITLASFSLFVSYAAFLLLAPPFLRWLSSRGRMTVLNVAVGGCILGAIAYYLFIHGFALLLGYWPPAAQMRAVAWGALFGLVTALAFVLVAGVPMRDKSHAIAS